MHALLEPRWCCAAVAIFGTSIGCFDETRDDNPQGSTIDPCEGYDGYDPVCGSDGAVHENRCEAVGADWTVASPDQCSLPDGLFACGHDICVANQTPLETCLRDADDPDKASCRGIASCGLGQGCWCFTEHEVETCGEPPAKVVDCVEVEPSQFVVTCGK